MQKKRRFLLFSILFLLVITTFALQTAGHENLTLIQEPREITLAQQFESINDHESTEFNLINSTLNGSIGMQDFEGDYALDYSADVVEIVVQFVTPPSEAFRISHERDIPMGGSFPGDSFEEQALMGHSVFREQLELIMPSAPIIPFNAVQMEIISANYLLFNGVFMRVSPNMVEQIASLPEVFAVFPNMSTSAPDIIPVGTETPEGGALNPNFMRETRELFNTNHIHNNMGLTGEGITVAVIDSGIYHDHPEFAPFRDPNTGRIPGFCFLRRIDDPSEVQGQSDFGHGTHVSGIVAAISPGVNLRSYRVLGTGGTWLQIVNAIEAAHLSSDIMNLSIHSNQTNIHFFVNYSLNLAALADTVVVVIAGNFATAALPPRLSVMASAGLPIVVGAGTAGGLFRPA